MALGILCAAGFAPFDFWPAAIAALVLLLRCAGAAPSWRSAWGTGWWFGLGLGLASFPWLAHAFSFQSAMPYWLGWVAVAGLSAYTALYWAVSLGLANALSRNAPPAIFAIHAAAIFVVAEWLRGWLLTGFPWNPLASIWMPVPDRCNPECKKRDLDEACKREAEGGEPSGFPAMPDAPADEQRHIWPRRNAEDESRSNESCQCRRIGHGEDQADSDECCHR